MPAEKFVVVGVIPGQDFDPGQVVSVGKQRDKLLHLKAVRPLRKGVELLACTCLAQFDSPGALLAHQQKRHPAPPPAPPPPPPPPASKPKKEEPKAPAPAPKPPTAPAPEPEAAPAVGGEENKTDEEAV